MQRCLLSTLFIYFSFYCVLHSAEEKIQFKEDRIIPVLDGHIVYFTHKYKIKHYTSPTQNTEHYRSEASDLSSLYEDAKIMRSLLCVNKVCFKKMIAFYADVLGYVTTHFAKDKLFTKEDLSTSSYKSLLIDAIAAQRINFNDTQKIYKFQQFITQRLLFEHSNSDDHVLRNKNIEGEIHIAFHLMKKIRYFTTLANQTKCTHFTFKVNFDAYRTASSPEEIKRIIIEKCTQHNIGIKQKGTIVTFIFAVQKAPFYATYLAPSLNSNLH